jgi:PAS domain S-box-containing protein
VSPANMKTMRLLTWSIGVSALLAALLSAAIVWLVQRENTEQGLVRHSRALSEQIAHVRLVVQRMESYQRGYLLTGRSLYLGNYNDTEKALPAMIDETAARIDGDLQQRGRLAELRRVVMEKADELRSTIDEQRAGRPDAARAIVNSDRGLEAMNQIRQILSEIKNREDQILSSRLSSLQTVSTLLQVGAPIPLLLIGAIGLLTGQYMRRSLSAITVALRQREHSQFRLQLAMDAARLGLWLYDPLHRVVAGDTRFKKIVDVAENEAPIKEIMERVNPNDMGKVWAAFNAVHDPAERKGSTIEFRLQRDGKIHWVETLGLAAHCEGVGGEREDACTIGTIRDITERKEHEELVQRQADLLDQSYDAIFALRIDGRGIVYWNRGAERVYGYTAAEAKGRRTDELLQTRAPIPIADIDAQIVHGGSWCGELTHTTRDGRDIVVESRIAYVSYDDDIYALETNRDITERKRAEEALHKSEERFKASVLRSPVPVVLFDDRERILAVSGSWLTAGGFLSAAEFQRVEDWTIRAYGERSGEILELVREIIATEPEARTDELVLNLGGEKRIWNYVTSYLGAQSDGRRLFLSVAHDVTDRRAYEERIDLLMREARHRTKNILGLVQAVARQTAAKDRPEDFVESFSERIQALAANQDLLVKNLWQGADVEDLVRVQLAHFADLVGSRIAVRGPKLRLNTAASQAVSLAVHELATNAGKYGALSTDAGCVDVSWQLDDGTYTIGWIERNGPPVRPPERRGFGSMVIESMAKGAVGGEVELNYAPSGLEWHLTCPAGNALEARADTV